jgi:ubiquinone/menaquinone biosynthesis C-methylase UbiE
MMRLEARSMKPCTLDGASDPDLQRANEAFVWSTAPGGERATGAVQRRESYTRQRHWPRPWRPALSADNWRKCRFSAARGSPFLSGSARALETSLHSRYPALNSAVPGGHVSMQYGQAATARDANEGRTGVYQPSIEAKLKTLTEKVKLACVQCRAPLELDSANRLRCPNGHGEASWIQVSEKSRGGGFWDLTPQRFRYNVDERPRGPSMELRRDLFQSPFVAFLYERGWRDQFRSSGFPGPDAEFRIVQSFFKGANCVMDLSCGSGLFTRRLAASGDFDHVIAVDYSEAMLRELVERAEREPLPERIGGGFVSDRITGIIRADVERLPFANESIDCIHAGAALHCWPCVQDGLHEVYRILRPSKGPGSGRFLATTFLWSTSPFGLAVREGRLLSPSAGYRFFDAKELEWLVKSAGFERVEIEVIRQCAIIRAWKEPRARHG